MINENVYLDTIKNCQRWNNKTIATRARSKLAVFDHQTGIVQRPTDTLYRSSLERCAPWNPLQVCSYPAKRYRRSKEISSDACEHKYFLSANPSISNAIQAITNPLGMLPPPQVSDSTYDYQSTPLRTGTNGNRMAQYDNYEIDAIDYDFDELDNDPSDEDDWGASKRRKKKRDQNASTSGSGRAPRRSAAVAVATSNNVNGGSGGATAGGSGSTANGAPNPPIESRNFICQHCGARYKSRPGLTYHRLHVHKEENMATEMPKILANSVLSPSLDVSKTCDLCEGTKDINKKTNVPEELVSCHDCGRSAHPSCVGFTPNMLITTRKYGWQCIECKSCTHCGTSEHDDQLLFCDDCDRGFHLYCLKPPLKEAPEGNWSCHLCQKEFGDKASLPPSSS